jgi:hypothetical protein
MGIHKRTRSGRSVNEAEKVRSEKLQNLRQNTQLSREQLVLTIKVTEVTKTLYDSRF